MSKSASSIVLRPSRKGTNSLGLRFEFVREKNDEYPHSRRARILDPIWIDEGIILNWKDLCDRHHGTACEYPERLTRMDAIQPTRLIDAVAGCLVPAQSGVLSKGSVADKLPMTIKNAIDVVRLIGERYLWVDTLCIVQDDAETLQAELNSMARIYTTSCELDSLNRRSHLGGSNLAYSIQLSMALTPTMGFEDSKKLLPNETSNKT
ncbi:hypothetical protein BTUL_0031g00450 [Botrytis tulipae]|uniref:Heterokaryon incompatibility domain-containing protein n=1 Tax=Botrytis tulipae TaxID=87230 RepID=A0A4Z1EXZ4_9HELO|nr:hypothetical protein BTUL_0031g00450 [Botrytis tulipae]